MGQVEKQKQINGKAMKQIDFEHEINRLKEVGYIPPPNAVYIQIPNAREILKNGLDHFVSRNGQSASWLPEYEEISGWLENNEGRGLMCYGSCGRGKTLICQHIIPLLLSHYYRRIVSIYDSQEMNTNIDAVKRAHLVYIDDVGIESTSVKFGEKRVAFCEIVYEAERKGHLLMFTTNLSKAELAEKYGDRTMDRLIAITRPVLFSGESLRG